MSKEITKTDELIQKKNNNMKNEEKKKIDCLASITLIDILTVLPASLVTLINYKGERNANTKEHKIKIIGKLFIIISSYCLSERASRHTTQ